MDVIITLRRILALIRKEFLALLQDPKSRFVIIGPPVAQLLVFSYAATFDITDVPFALYDEDQSAVSRQLVARFEGSPNFRLVQQVRDGETIERLVNNREVLMVLRIGPSFSRDLLTRGSRAPVQVIIDGRDSNTASIVLGYVRTIVTDFNEQWAADHGARGPPARLVTRAWFNENLESRWFIVPGIIGLLTLVVTTLVTSLSVAREREQGTFDQLLVTPLRPTEILLGKAAPGFVIGLFEATIIIAIAVFWFEVPLRGELTTLYAGLALFLLSAVGAGLMVSSLAVTQQQGLLGAFLFLVPAIILSGFATPIDNMPGVVQAITLIDPLRYFMIILRDVFLKGSPFELLVQQLWPMALIGVVALALAGWLFRHRMY
jgi:ABC-2 type transport system permease protein